MSASEREKLFAPGCREKVRVYSERCARCLYGPNSLTWPSLAKRLRDQISGNNQAGFQCHRGDVRGEVIHCHGFYLAHPERFADYDVEFVEQPPADPFVDWEEAEPPNDRMIIFEDREK